MGRSIWDTYQYVSVLNTTHGARFSGISTNNFARKYWRVLYALPLLSLLTRAFSLGNVLSTATNEFMTWLMQTKNNDPNLFWILFCLYPMLEYRPPIRRP